MYKHHQSKTKRYDMLMRFFAVERLRQAAATMARSEYGDPDRVWFHHCEHRSIGAFHARSGRTGMLLLSHKRYRAAEYAHRTLGTIMAVLQLRVRPFHVSDHGQHRWEAGQENRHLERPWRAL
jgi:hypothetical protein